MERFAKKREKNGGVREARELLHGHCGATRAVEAQFLARKNKETLAVEVGDTVADGIV